MAVVVSGSALASLFFELINSPGDQEGFLIGQVHKRVTDTISDSQITNVKEETVIAIQSHIPCLGLFSFYNSAGSLNFQKLVELLGEKIKNVVGWYRFRRNTTPSITLRERALHFQLQDAFPTITSHHFLFMLSGCSLSANNALHNFDHVIMHAVDRCFQPLVLSVVNLGDTSHVEYKLFNTLATSKDSGMFGSLVSEFEKLFVDPGGQIGQIGKVQEMKANVQEHIQVLSQDVMETEQHLQSLHKEVEVLRERLRHKESKHNENAKVPHKKNKALPPEPEPEPVVENLLVFEAEPGQRKANTRTPEVEAVTLTENQVILSDLSKECEQTEKETNSATNASCDIAFMDEDVVDDTVSEQLNGDTCDQKEHQMTSDLTSVGGATADALSNHQGAQEQDSIQEKSGANLAQNESSKPGKPDEHFSFVQDILAEAKRPRRTAAIKTAKLTSDSQGGGQVSSVKSKHDVCGENASSNLATGTSKGEKGKPKRNAFKTADRNPTTVQTCCRCQWW
ncbi:BRISC complex subunit Abraxas 2 [Lingula anatina]|uniref:BRISC complex subunit Abraxas 2 n=1 Tax=Lingula anatina TaxID=7574 RepID=A0A1S3HI56_LINAN|nr:BRISC complex subunit Abraxas 2 [Lingula anatina]|eukprot:XP_013384674.1 BRISC complex subunit Abraxas 2 [Lingula anatina]